MTELDKRTKRGRELADRLNKQTILDRMPKLYYVNDSFHDCVRIGRTDWPGDAFEIVPNEDFTIFKRIYDRLNMPFPCKDDDD